MRKILKAELSAENGLVTELALPATPYELLDALEKLRLAEGEEPRWEILRAPDCATLTRRHKLRIVRPAASGRTRSFRCASSPHKAERSVS